MYTATEIQAAKNTVISNIQTMRNLIGVNPLSFESLNGYRLEELQEMQNSIIQHYNEPLRNTPKK